MSVRLVPVLAAECRATIHRYIDGIFGSTYTGNCTCGAVYRDRERSTVEALLVAHNARIVGGAA